MAPSEPRLPTHIRLAHANDPNFSIQCTSNGCGRTFTNFRTYQNHRLTHRCDSASLGLDANAVELDENNPSPLPIDACTTSAISLTTSEMQHFTVKWVLKTRETRNLTRMAMQGIIEDVGELVIFVSQTLESQVHAALSSHGVVPELIPDVDGIFSGSLYSFHQQVQYCLNHFYFIVIKLL